MAGTRKARVPMAEQLRLLVLYRKRYGEFYKTYRGGCL